MSIAHPNSPGVQPQQPATAKVTYPGTQPVVKKQPAPGQSPVGGTTSLPQNLQTPRSPTDSGTSSRPAGPIGANPTMQPAPAAPAQPTPASTPAGMVPPAPPPPAPPAAPPAATPTSPATATPEPSGNSQMGDDLFKQLMEMLSNPSRYGSEQAQATRTQGYAKLDDERRLSEDRAKADAARRGVYNGTPLTNSLGDIGERYLRGGAELETNIQRDQAQQFQQDRMAAIQAIFGYGDRQRMDEQQQNDLWLKLLELGYVDGPQRPGNSGVPIPGGV